MASIRYEIILEERVQELERKVKELGRVLSEVVGSSQNMPATEQFQLCNEYGDK